MKLKMPFFVLATFLFVFFQTSFGFSFEVRPGEEETFMEEFKQGIPVTLMYQVLEGGLF